MTKSPSHLATLDGLRGLAAIAVVLFHISYGWKNNIMPHAYLAVDFFFALSGYVIAKSYEAKLHGALRFREFLKLRLVRLYPLIFLGTLLGFADCAVRYVNGLPTGMTAPNLLTPLVLGLLLIPMVFNASALIFPLNSPVWSLFYEMVANVFYAGLLKHLSDARLYGIMAVSALVLIYSGFVTAQTGHGPVGADLGYGLARVGFSFFAGIMLFRLVQRGLGRNWPHVPGLWLGAALLGLLLVPAFQLDWVYNLFAIFLLFPLIVLLGVDERSPPARYGPAALWLGRISYPLYVLHFPVLINNDYHLLHDYHGIIRAGVIAGAVAGMVLLAWLALVLYDEPLRRWLGRRPALRPVRRPASPAMRKLAPQRAGK